MTKTPEFSTCPYCEGTKFVEIEQGGYAQATRVGYFFKTANLIHLVCVSCGAVIHSRVKNIESLLTKSEKEERA